MILWPSSKSPNHSLRSRPQLRRLPIPRSLLPYLHWFPLLSSQLLSTHSTHPPLRIQSSLSLPETTTVEHLSTLSPMRQSPSDQCTSDKVNSASNPVMPELSRLSSSLSISHHPRGSRRRPKSTMPPPLDVPRSSTHAYDTRRKRIPLPLALNATAFHPSSRLPTSLHSLHLSLIMPPEYQLHYVDWTNFVNATDTNNQVYYYSFKQNAYLVFDSSDPPPPDYHTSSTANSPIHEGYRAIRDNVSKSFAKALLDPEWVDSARSELHTIVKENNAIVLIDPELARQHICDGAEVLYMHPVYEKKRRQGCQKGSSCHQWTQPYQARQHLLTYPIPRRIPYPSPYHRDSRLQLLASRRKARIPDCRQD